MYNASVSRASLTCLYLTVVPVQTLTPCMLLTCDKDIPWKVVSACKLSTRQAFCCSFEIFGVNVIKKFAHVMYTCSLNRKRLTWFKKSKTYFKKT